MRITRFVTLALGFFAPLAAADNPQLLAEFRKTRPEVSEVHVIAETPLLVAVSGPQGTRTTPADWAKGELLGVFAHRGEQIVQISMVPNNDFASALWIERQGPDFITFGIADPDYGMRSDSLKIFFDPKSYFPKAIMRFAPVHVRRIAVTAGVLTLLGSDGKREFTAREQNGAWRITAAPGIPHPVEDSVAEVTQATSNFTQTPIDQQRPLKPDR